MRRPGDRVGPFALVELIASRPLAALWKAQRADGSSREPRVVVIRVAHEAMDPRAMTELRREYEALRAIEDPRVRKAHGYYAGHGALALEFVDGVSLRWVLDRAAEGQVTLDVATLIDLGVELCEALRAVHRADVVHARICADTVRLRRDGSPVLTDFAAPQERLEVHPPEFADGAPITAATDQWLLGALLAHLVTQEPLLGGAVGNPADGRDDLSATLASVSVHSPSLGRVLARMLARDPRDRYGDWGMLHRDLLATLRTTGERPDRERLARRAQGSAGPRPLPSPIAPSAHAPEPALAARSHRPPIEELSTGLQPHSFTPIAAHLVEVVYDESLPPEVHRRLSDDLDPEPVRQGAPSDEPEPRLVPDWAASFALVLLLSVGIWAVMSRFL